MKERTFKGESQKTCQERKSFIYKMKKMKPIFRFFGILTLLLTTIQHFLSPNSHYFSTLFKFSLQRLLKMTVI